MGNKSAVSLPMLTWGVGRKAAWQQPPLKRSTSSLMQRTARREYPETHHTYFPRAHLERGARLTPGRLQLSSGAGRHDRAT